MYLHVWGRHWTPPYRKAMQCSLPGAQPKANVVFKAIPFCTALGVAVDSMLRVPRGKVPLFGYPLNLPQLRSCLGRAAGQSEHVASR